MTHQQVLTYKGECVCVIFQDLQGYIQEDPISKKEKVSFPSSLKIRTYMGFLLWVAAHDEAQHPKRSLWPQAPGRLPHLTHASSWAIHWVALLGDRGEAPPHFEDLKLLPGKLSFSIIYKIVSVLDLGNYCQSMWSTEYLSPDFSLIRANRPRTFPLPDREPHFRSSLLNIPIALCAWVAGYLEWKCLGSSCMS